MPTLHEYLGLPNPELDRTTLRPGTNTLPVGTYEIEGVQPWDDFTLETVLNCFGDILRRDFETEDLHYPPPLPQHHRRLTDESCVESILKKHNHTIIDRALELAQSRLDGRGLHLPISMSWGSLADVQEDRRLRPDWAGTIHTGLPPYENRVSGDTKPSSKWSSAMKDSASVSIQEEYWKPLRQLLLYCVRVNTRYGYIISDAEALFFRRTKSQEPPTPLSANRSRRQPPPAHTRVTSLTSVVSGISAMSVDSSGSPYTDAGNPDINEAPLEIAIIPWANSGTAELTINLGVWFIHILATSDISVEESYHPLGSWRRIKDEKGHWCFQQEGSRRVSQTLPERGVLLEAAP